VYCSRVLLFKNQPVNPKHHAMRDRPPQPKGAQATLDACCLCNTSKSAPTQSGLTRQHNTPDHKGLVHFSLLPASQDAKTDYKRACTTCPDLCLAPAATQHSQEPAPTQPGTSAAELHTRVLSVPCPIPEQRPDTCWQYISCVCTPYACNTVTPPDPAALQPSQDMYVYGYTTGCPLSTAAAPQSSTQHSHPAPTQARAWPAYYNTPQHCDRSVLHPCSHLMPANCVVGQERAARPLHHQQHLNRTPSTDNSSLYRLPSPKKGKMKGKKPAGRLWRTAG
jgi:hypothetical protein